VNVITYFIFKITINLYIYYIFGHILIYIYFYIFIHIYLYIFIYYIIKGSGIIRNVYNGDFEIQHPQPIIIDENLNNKIPNNKISIGICILTHEINIIGKYYFII